MQYRELVLLEKLLALTAADADLEYSILRGTLDADDVRAIHQGLQVAIETLRERSTAVFCADCSEPIGEDDGREVDNGRTLCTACFNAAMLRCYEELKQHANSIVALQTALANLQKATQG